MSPLRPRDLAGEWCHDAAVSTTPTDGEDTVGAGRLPWVPGDAVLVWSRGMGAWREAVVARVAWPLHRRVLPESDVELPVGTVLVTYVNSLEWKCMYPHDQPLVLSVCLDISKGGLDASGGCLLGALLWP